VSDEKEAREPDDSKQELPETDDSKQELPKTDEGSAASLKGAASSKSAAAAEGEATKEPKGETKDPADKSKPAKRETWSNTLVWALGIVAVLGVELYIYGHDGDIQVCVGIEQLTDYSIRAEARTKANATKHPFCAKRLNLGRWSSSEKLSEEALKEACGAASRVVGAEHRQKCLRRDEPWSRFVETKHIPPWDARLYRRLLWLD
jgi:hypothetical protein